MIYLGSNEGERTALRIDSTKKISEDGEFGVQWTRRTVAPIEPFNFSSTLTFPLLTVACVSHVNVNVSADQRSPGPVLMAKKKN